MAVEIIDKGKIMAVEIIDKGKGGIVAGERLYLTADRSKVVKAGDKAAAFLLAAKGNVIPKAAAERLGLTGSAKSEDAKAKTPPTSKGDAVENLQKRGQESKK